MATSQPSREFIDASEFATLQRTGTVLLTERRRPLYFDGRFLAAADLTAEQTYFLGRQATLNRLSGFGVLQGLEVSRPTGTGDQLEAFQVAIAPGCGVTPSGESVILENPLTISLANTARIEMLNAAFGVGEAIRDPARSQTGLFILGLRLVEYSDTLIASYPTSSTGPGNITSQFGEIVEATAVTLVRYSNLEGERLRSQIARDIFVNETVPNLPANLLPLAMVALDQGAVRWIDNFLVRRDLGSTAQGTLGLNTVPRALRSAHLLQYDQQLREIEPTATAGFSAASYFDTLPAAGRLPKSAVNPADFSQRYFPAEVTVELTVAPTDEIAALVEDSLALPPIDLQDSPAEFETLSLLLIIPMTRQQLYSFRQDLAAATVPPPTPSPQPIFQPIFQPGLRRPLTLAAPGLIAKRNPLEKLSRLNQSVLPILPPANPVDSLWRTALANAAELWYIRQRNIPYQADIVGTTIPLASDDASVESNLIDRLDRLNLSERFSDLRTSTLGRADVVSLLSSPQISRSELLLRSTLNELENAPIETPSGDPTVPPTERPIDRATVLRVAEQFGDPRLGEGLSRLEAIAPEIRENDVVVNTLATSGDAIALDKIARTLSPTELTSFSRELTTLAGRGNTAAVNSLVRNRLEAIQ
ncbi:hypothetical protein [Leptothoe sp. PORK10 BA2]|uniref:hypothetical protein n=1 Tax=Leptothoe sp. PORK10 BA2 TaxID=3110254 RepID=UPI002B1F2408|nr:hypothetical protein [Leptothoe sp. PORK10 BA2]MEA5463929.1 hypothetical protein [Leptothoe sp. PORK10 BA2]